MTEYELNELLMPCLSSSYSESDFISAAVQIDEDGLAKHAGIIVKFDGEVYLCHQLKGIVIDTNFENNWYFFKEFQFINPILAPSIVGICKILGRENANPPRYNMMYNGEFFTLNNASDEHSSKFMTCVGFCLSIIKGLLSNNGDKEFLIYEDWTHEDGVDNLDSWINYYLTTLEEHTLSIDEIKNKFRRIDPADFLATAYMNNAPISKKSIYGIKLELIKALKSKSEIMKHQ